MRAACITLLGVSLLMPQAAHANGMSGHVHRAGIPGHGTRFGPIFLDGAVVPDSYGGTPVVVIVVNPAPAPACKPQEPRRLTVETTPSGVEIVRGPGPNAPAC